MFADLIRKEIERLPTSKKINDTRAMVCCPFHKDDTPSCSINLDPNLFHKGHKVSVGYFSCFGCPAKGRWNEFAEKTGLQKFGSDGSGEQTEELAYGRKIKQQVFRELTEVELLDALSCVIYKPLEVGTKWRGFNYKFLRHLNPWSALCADSGERCLVFPVYGPDNELIGGFKAWFQRPHKGSPFLNMPGQWVRDDALWPLPLVIGCKVIWLVEGQRDALRLIRMGIPALCIFGTNNWSSAKRDLLISLGVERVVLCFDGDKAGIKATNDIARSLQESDVSYKNCKLAHYARENNLEKIDPFDAPKELIHSLYKKYGKGCTIKNRPWKSE